jgi:hypothetical protein
MVTDDMRSRVEQELRNDPTGISLIALAKSLRDEGASQLALYRLFVPYYVETAADDPLYDAIFVTLEAIWSPRGHGLFATELTNEEVADARRYTHG